MKDRQKTVIYILLLVMIGGFMFTYRLGVRGLAEPDEGRYAEVAREMLESGDWLLPRYNYILHMHKPPMAYWLIASSQSIFGVNEFACRFPSVLAGMATVIAVFLMAKRLSNATTGFVAGLMLITMPQFMGSARLAFPDMFLTCFITLGFASFLRGCYVEKKTVPFLFYWFFAALGMMTKGPVTLVIMLVPVIIYCIAMKDRKLLRDMRPVSGTVLFLLISLPWYLYAVIQLPGLLGSFLGEQTAQRLTSGFRAVPPFYLVGVLGPLSFPWIFYSLAGVLALFVNRLKTNSDERLRYLAVIWFFTVMVFFSLLRSSIMSYILPAYPPMAIIGAIFLTRQFERKSISFAFMLASAATIVGGLVFGSVSMYYFRLAGGDAMYGFLQNTLIVYAAIFAVSSLAVLVFLLIRKPRTIFVSLTLLVPMVFMVFFHKIPEIEQRTHWRVKSKHLAEKILEIEEDGDEVVMIRRKYIDLPFYLQRRVLHLHVKREKRFEHPRVYDKLVLFGRDNEERLVRSDTRTFFVCKMSEYEDMKSRYPENVFFVMEANKHVLFCNKLLDEYAEKTR